MYYVIERVLTEDIPFDKTWMTFTMNNKIYDIVKARKDTGLDRISDFIVDDNKVVTKADPRKVTEFKFYFTKATGMDLNELLLD